MTCKKQALRTTFLSHNFTMGVYFIISNVCWWSMNTLESWNYKFTRHAQFHFHQYYETHNEITLFFFYFPTLTCKRCHSYPLLNCLACKNFCECYHKSKGKITQFDLSFTQLVKLVSYGHFIRSTLQNCGPNILSYGPRNRLENSKYQRNVRSMKRIQLWHFLS